MTVYEQAKKYLAAIPPSISGQGGHNQALNAARALKWGFNLSDSDAMALLAEWNQACQPPWSQAELEHKLREADTKDFGKPRGYLLSGRAGAPTGIRRSVDAPAVGPPDLPKIDYDLSQTEPLPQGLPDGFEKVLRSCFQPGEGVRVMSGVTEDGLVGCDPHGGAVLSREEWLAKLEKHGDINGMYYRMGGPPVGVYLGINPMREDGRGRDTDVTSYRHVLLEFDEISLEEQWLLYTKSNLPCAAIIYSGNKSLHAWVKIHARDRKEFDQRVNLVYNHFQAYKPDAHNRNPSRFSRCPDARRGNGYQLLIALDTGAASFTEWSRNLIVQGIGTTYYEKGILAYNADADGMTVAGHHWLRKGNAALLVGPSGVGKSSLGRQLAMSWALGRACFGVRPARPLKILMVQAENDQAELHDMDTGIARGLGILDDPAAIEQIHANLVTNHNVADTGLEFIVALQKLVDHHQPDLVIVDPLLSFIGNDISKQEVVGQFCRNWLNPILSGSNVAFLGIHHTGKPPKEVQPGNRGARPVKTMAEWAYHMIGSSELTNWARAVVILNPVGNDEYDLLFCKRGRRAQATHPDGTPTETVHLKHSPGDDIFWIHIDPPEECASATETAFERGRRPTLNAVTDKIANSSDIGPFVVACPPDGERYRVIAARLTEFCANVLHNNLSGSSIQRVLNKCVANQKLARKGTLYVKGPQA